MIYVKWLLKVLNLYDFMAKKEKLKFDKLNKGIIHLYMDKKHTEKAEFINKIYKKAGLKRFRITHQELYDLEPALKNKKLDSIFLLLLTKQVIYINFAET